MRWFTLLLLVACGDARTMAEPDAEVSSDAPADDTSTSMDAFAADDQSTADVASDMRTSSDAMTDTSDTGTSDTGPPPCPADTVCVDALPFVHTDDTSSSPRSEIDSYGCAPDVDESGPERWYRVTVDEPGFLALSLSELGEGVDVDVHLLEADTCVDRGHWRAGGYVEPGVYDVVVDSWVDGVALAGRYTLAIAHTSADDLIEAGVSADIADTALRVFDRAWAQEDTNRLEYAIIDFSLHSRYPREWIIDLANEELLWSLHVAHGEGSNASSDAGLAATFSNTPESHQSSVGLVRTGELYVGDYGPSHRLDGLEPGINDNVRDRAIVMHPWTGSRQEYVDANGLTAPTWGCPAIDDRLADRVRQRMAGGALMWFWAPDTNLLTNSNYLAGLPGVPTR